jgi:hypothetical protein
MIFGCKLSKDCADLFPDLFTVLGALLYATIPSPDIWFFVNKVWKFMSQPREAHWTVIKK